MKFGHRGKEIKDEESKRRKKASISTLIKLHEGDLRSYKQYNKQAAVPI